MSRNFSTPSEGPENKEKSRFLPNKTLGQNFLSDTRQIAKLVSLSDIKKTDVILEIGPGTGAMTVAMAPLAQKIIAVEKDSKVLPLLEKALSDADVKNVEIINGDILDFFSENTLMVKGKYKVVANIPYYLTSFLIRRLLEADNPPQDIFLLIQEEVARRICAKPPKMSLLSVAVNYYARPRILARVSRQFFRPRPKVDSAFIEITPKGEKKNEAFFDIVRAGFSHPRKQLLNNLAEGLKTDKEKTADWLSRLGIDGKRRAETLSLEEWLHLYKGKTIIE